MHYIQTGEEKHVRVYALVEIKHMSSQLKSSSQYQ